MLQPDTLYALIDKVSQQIREKLKNARYEFDGSFDSSQEVVPPELIILIDSIVNGCSDDLEFGFSLPVETIAELIVYNHKSQKRSNSKHQRHNAHKESPTLVYIGLKVYAATRSRKIVDILHKLGLCISYDRILRITQGLGEAAIDMFEEDDYVVPGNLRKGIFTIGAKDNVDKNSSSTVTKSHYHGTSLSLFQFPSAVNTGKERKCKKIVKIKSSEGKKSPRSTSFLHRCE